MHAIPDSAPVDHTSPRRRAALAVLLVALIFVATIVTRQVTASAIPPRCPDGTNPPCDIVGDPTTTTASTVPPPPQWSSSVSVLDETGSATPFPHSMWGAFISAGTPSYSTPSGTVVWSATDHDEGTFPIQQTYLPSGDVTDLQMRLNGDDGPVCRSQPAATVLPSGRSIHVLLVPAISESATDISALAAGFQGPVTPAINGSDINVTSASAHPSASGLTITVTGTIHKDVTGPDFDGHFTYTTTLSLQASRRIDDPSEVVVAKSPSGTLNITPDGTIDSVEQWIDGGDYEPQFRSTVAAKVTDAINATVAGNAQAAWFTSLGYTVSARKVTTTSSAVTVLPALCKVA